VATKDEPEETEQLRAEFAALRTELENLRRQRDTWTSSTVPTLGSWPSIVGLAAEVFT